MLQSTHQMILEGTLTAGAVSRIQGGDQARHIQRTRAARAFGTLPSAYLIILGQSCGRTTPLFPPFTHGRLRRQNSGLVLGSRDPGPGARRGALREPRFPVSRARILFPPALKAAGLHDHADRRLTVRSVDDLVQHRRRAWLPSRCQILACTFPSLPFSERRTVPFLP